MLHELEESLGETLFDRIGRGLTLNTAGQAVLNTFRTMRNSMASLERELHELRLGSSGKLLIGSTTYTVSNDLGLAVSALKEDYPLLSIRLSVDTSDRLIELLRDGRLDVVIARMPEPASPANLDCVFTPIGRTSLSVVAACNHPLTQAPKRQRFEFQALLDYPWVFQLPGSPTREIIEQEFRSHHAALPLGLVETSSYLATIELIVNSRMIAVIPQSIANRYARHNLLRILPYTFVHTPMPRGSLVHRDRHINAVMRRFLDLMHGTPS
jgi:DNA-binding transcriptional LysR family regulator